MFPKVLHCVDVSKSDKGILSSDNILVFMLE